MARKSIPKPLYQFLITESRGLCNLCHRTTIDEIHHIIPVEEGGGNDYDNLICLCGSCHSKLHKTTYDARQLLTAKAEWLQECHYILGKIMSSASTQDQILREVFSSFDAVKNIKEFEGFHFRLEQLQQRGFLFKNLFRVHHHQIHVAVDKQGNAKVHETQRWSSFVDVSRRAFHIEGPTPCCKDQVMFDAVARLGKKLVDTYVTIDKDHPTLKSFIVHFRKNLPAFQPITTELSYAWPESWNLNKDRYTYDVLGWAERVVYSMSFPDDVVLSSLHDSYIDIVSSQWDSIGTFSRLSDKQFEWTATRLPLFSTAVIEYQSKNTPKT
jgi:hypothetical protein